MAKKAGAGATRTQVRLASELGLGTLANPKGLPYSRDNDVVTVIEAMSRDALDATIGTIPTYRRTLAAALRKA